MVKINGVKSLSLWGIVFALSTVLASAETDVQFLLTDPQFGISQTTNRLIQLQAETYASSGSTTLLPFKVTQYTDNSGQTTFSNIYGSSISGWYHVTIPAPPQRWESDIWVSSTNLGFINVNTIFGVWNPSAAPAGGWSWTAAASDARYGSSLTNASAFDTNGAATAVQSGVVSGSIVAAIAVKATNAPDGNVSASLNQSTNIALVAAQNATNGLPSCVWTLGTASAQNTNVFLGTNFAVTTLNGLTNNFSVDSTGKGTLTIGNTNSTSGGVTNGDDLNYLQGSGYLYQSIGYDVSTTAGVPITMVNIAGSGVIKKIYMVLGGGAGTGGWQGHLQIYADGEAIPDVDAELGTLFLTGQGVFSAASFTASTKHIKMGCNSGQGIVGASFFEVPFTNGCKVVYYAPSYVNSGDILFWQVAYQTNSNPFPNLRLKSVCLPLTSAVDYPSNAIINLFDETNMAGWLVWKGVNTFSTNGLNDYLERIWFYGADNEVLTTNGGVVSGRYGTSGGEDESDLGWFFLGGLRVAGDPHSMVTLDSAGKVDFGYEFLDQGGIHFTNSLLCGWSLKPVVFQSDVTIGYTYLFYDNIAVPYPPAQASLSGSFTSNSISLNIINPISQGSSPITGWFITLTNTVAKTNATFYTEATNSALTIAGVVGTNGANYAFNITASNNIGAGWTSTNFTFAAYVPPPTPTNILANRIYYFNGNLSDSSGNGFTLSGNPSPNYQTGQNGLANNAIDAYYTDTNDVVGVAATYPLTLTAWVKLPVGFSSGYIFGEFNNASPSSNAHYLYVSSSGMCQAATAANGYLTANSAVNVAAGWHFLAGVFSNPTNRVIYVDGVASGTNTTSGTPSGLNCVGNPGVFPGIGGPSASTGNILDDCRVFTNALTSGQIANLYNYGAQ